MVISPATRNLIDSKLEHDLPMRIACRLLYELAARCQDLLEFRFDSFKQDQRGAVVKWKPKKTVRKGLKRLGLITKETYHLITEY